MKKNKFLGGFTLIELVIVLVILGVLLLALITTFNPLAQYNKANDGEREHDLGQIQRALDAYFNDKGCYPSSITFGSKWSSGSQVYMEKVPQDPDCSTSPSKCYVYQTDPNSTCPQWSILYSSLRSSNLPTNACPLSIRTSCLPNGYSSNGYNYCVIAGDIDCAAISSSTIQSSPPVGGGGGGGATSTPTPGPTATPTPGCAGDQYYGCTGDNRCNSIAPSSQCTQFGGSITCYCDVHCNQSCRYN